MSSETMQHRKKELRVEMLARRRGLSLDEVVEKSRRILARVAAMPEVVQAEVVLSYVASKDNEVDTKPFISAMLLAGKRVCVPVAKSDGVMCWAEIQSLDELQPGRFGILEPAPDAACIIEAPEESVCLVPGLAFTVRGDRLGYGGGYFDRFLSGYGGFPVGIAYACQLLESLPVGAQDTSLPCVVTEEAFLCCT